MLGLHLVLVTLHGWFTISIEKDKQKSVTLNKLLSVVFCVPFSSHFIGSEREFNGAMCKCAIVQNFNTLMIYLGTARYLCVT